MISVKPGIYNYFFGRNLYRVVLFPLLIGLFLQNKLDACCVTKERTYNQLRILQRLLGFDLYLFLDRGKDSLLRGPEGDEIPIRLFL